MKFSIIIPVYNNSNGIKKILKSLKNQNKKNFKIIIIEDGSLDIISKYKIKKFKKKILIKHYKKKKNKKPGISRNYGIKKIKNNFFIFFDSDCIIPKNYFKKINLYIKKKINIFGGIEKSKKKSSIVNKSINYTMTSFLTTNGIRGSTKKIKKFIPRTFNMGISKKIYKKFGGFYKIEAGEDIDLSLKIKKYNSRTILIKNLYIFHKRKKKIKKFFKQLYKFGKYRFFLGIIHKKSLKIIYFLPLLILLIFIKIKIKIIIIIIFIILIDSLCKEKNIKISILSILSILIQTLGYGIGFLKSFIKNILKFCNTKF